MARAALKQPETLIGRTITYYDYPGSGIVTDSIFDIDLNEVRARSRCTYDQRGNLVEFIRHSFVRLPDYWEELTELIDTVTYYGYDNHPNPARLHNLAFDPGPQREGPILPVNNPARAIRNLAYGNPYDRDRDTIDYTYTYNNKGLVTRALILKWDTYRITGKIRVDHFEYTRRR